MELRFDPARGQAFWAAVQSIEGYPRGEDVRLRSMSFEQDGVQRLPAILADAGARQDQPLLVVMDQTPMRRGSEELKPLVLRILQDSGWTPLQVVAPPDRTGQVHTDLEQIGHVQAGLREGCAVLSVGSGTITDVAKHACHRFEQDSGARIPFVVFQTAHSVNAFTSNMALTLVDGVKRTLPSRYPDALVCDLETLRDAPYAMTAAGVGDLLAAGVSFADWRLAHSLGLDESYTPLAETMMGRLGATLEHLAPSVRRRDLQAMGDLAKLIALAGLAMSLSHATTPLSGHEHVMSHVIDMLAEAEGRPVAVHGAQVAVTALLMSSVYSAFLGAFDPGAHALGTRGLDVAEARRDVELAFASMGPGTAVASECWRDYAVKLEAWRERQAESAEWGMHWPDLREELARRVWPAASMRRIMLEAGLPATFQALVPPVADVHARRAFLSAHWIRRRFTLGDLLYFTGWDREALWEHASAQDAGLS
jgi:glycerol-1-phosphate dehydrogenase [NAD(P)+]